MTPISYLPQKLCGKTLRHIEEFCFRQVYRQTNGMRSFFYDNFVAPTQRIGHDLK